MEEGGTIAIDGDRSQEERSIGGGDRDRSRRIDRESIERIIVNRSGRSIAIDRDQSGRSIGEIVIDRIEKKFLKNSRKFWKNQEK